jgi:hypothetical protein
MMTIESMATEFHVKQCDGCLAGLHFDDFPIDANSADGRANICSHCLRRQQLENRQCPDCES